MNLDDTLLRTELSSQEWVTLLFAHVRYFGPDVALDTLANDYRLAFGANTHMSWWKGRREIIKGGK